MRALVTRPADQAERTAKRLAALGHQPVVAPALEIVPTGAAPPDQKFDLILATSAQAFAGWSATALLRGAPLACVGEKTAEAGKAAGFAPLLAAPRAEKLVERLVAAHQPGSALYLAGRERKPDLEQGLRAAGWRLRIVETYDARPVAAWPPAVAAALARGEIDAVLHFSPRSARAALGLIGERAAQGLLHLCLSEDVAAICRAGVPAGRILTAFQPDEDSLLQMLGPSGRASGSESR
jgi:uroporphyrinogen-III synthase